MRRGLPACRSTLNRSVCWVWKCLSQCSSCLPALATVGFIAACVLQQRSGSFTSTAGMGIDIHRSLRAASSMSSRADLNGMNVTNESRLSICPAVMRALLWHSQPLHDRAQRAPCRGSSNSSYCKQAPRTAAIPSKLYGGGRAQTSSVRTIEGRAHGAFYALCGSSERVAATLAPLRHAG